MALLESTTTQKSTPVFTPEAMQAMLQDFAAMQTILGRMSAQHAPIFDYLGGQTSLDDSMLAQPTKEATATARKAVGTAVKQKGMSGRSAGSVDAMLGSEEPDLISPLGQYAKQYAGGIDSLIDPRLSQFLKPDTITSSSNKPSGLDIATTALKTGGAVASAFL